MPEALPEAPVFAVLTTTVRLVALATLPKEAPPPEAPTATFTRLAVEELAKKPCGTAVPSVVV